jgi:hypothetical protein
MRRDAMLAWFFGCLATTFLAIGVLAVTPNAFADSGTGSTPFVCPGDCGPVSCNSMLKNRCDGDCNDAPGACAFNCACLDYFPPNVVVDCRCRTK